MLRELELLPVARLYGMETQRAAPAVRDAPSLPREAPAIAPAAPPQGLRMLLVTRAGGQGQRWGFLADEFDGAAGNLLDNMLAAIGARREGEPAALVDRDVKRAPPDVIVALGAAAATHLLESETDLAGLRGQVHRYNDVPVVVTHAPGHLLGHGAAKGEAWQDLLLARRAASAEA